MSATLKLLVGGMPADINEETIEVAYNEITPRIAQPTQEWTYKPLLSSIQLDAMMDIASKIEGCNQEEEVVQMKCRNLLSFPDNFASVIYASKATTSLIEKDLFLDGVFDCFWALCFSGSSDLEKSHRGLVCAVSLSRSQIESFIYTFSTVVSKRAMMEAFSQRLLRFLPHQHVDKNLTVTRLTTVTIGILKGSLERGFGRRTANLSRVSPAWRKWLLFLLELIVSVNSSHVTQIVKELFNFFILLPEEGESEKIKTGKFVRAFVFQDAVCRVATSRAIIKNIYECFYITLQKAGNELIIEKSLRAIFTAWNANDRIISGERFANEALTNSVLYAMIFLHNDDERVKGFPPAHLPFLLNGISIRLDSVYEDTRRGGMTVAAAFAALFVGNAETVENFLKQENFAQCFQEWCQADENVSLLKTRQEEEIVEAKEKKQLVRTEVCNSDVCERALDPDESYLFFTLMGDNTSRSLLVPSPTSEEKDNTPQSTTTATLGLPKFGIQKHEEDYSDAKILRTFRESYEALIGIGRVPNAQMHEVQQSLESALLGLSKVLQHEKKKLHVQSLSNEILLEMAPLVPTLLTTLMSMTLYAPEKKLQDLHKMRYNILVDIIVVSPKMSVSQLSRMIYNSNHGIFQRIEMIKAIGEAASLLSSITLEPLHTSRTSNTRPNKRIYPPIENTVVTKQAIVASEGSQTRRWGNAVQSRQVDKDRIKRHANLLGDYAQLFLASLLSASDSGHFKFFQDSDPYAPAEIMRTIEIIFISLTPVRHIVVQLCEKQFHFVFLVATKHPHFAVKKQGWMTLGELMRSWCGAGPLVERGTQSIYSIRKNYSSLMFSDEWMKALGIIQETCVGLHRSNDPCYQIAALITSDLRDILAEQSEYEEIKKDAPVISV